MLEFFSSIVSFLEALGSFVSSLLSGVFFMLQMIPQAMGTMTVALGYMPAVIVTFATAGLTICIVWHILGR